MELVFLVVSTYFLFLLSLQYGFQSGGLVPIRVRLTIIAL